MLHALTLSLAMSSTAWCGGGGCCSSRGAMIGSKVDNTGLIFAAYAVQQMLPENPATLLVGPATLAMPPQTFPAMVPLWWKKP